MRITVEHVGSKVRKEGVLIQCEYSGRNPVARVRLGLSGIFYFRLTNGYGHENQCRHWRIIEIDEVRAYAKQHHKMDVRPGPPPQLKLAPSGDDKPRRRSHRLKVLHPRQTSLFEESPE